MHQHNCERRDPVELLLKGILRNALLYGGAWALAACADAEKPDGGRTTSDVDAGSSRHCAQRKWIEASDLAPSESYDYLAVRRFDRNDVSGGAGSWMIQSQVGEPCASSSDAAACEAALDAAPSDCMSNLFSMVGCSELSAVTTRGDDVTRWVGTQDSLALLGEIDTRAEAELIAILAGYNLCDIQATRATAAGYEVNATPETGCTPKAHYLLRVDRQGDIEELSSEPLSIPIVCAGRVPDGLCSRAADLGEDALGDLLARVAHLEAASVFAFERLARELSAHGAPAHLIRATLAARRDEINHARTISELARAYGGEPVEARVLPFAMRTLEEIARENAVEGCVRETYGALVGAHQAGRALEADLRHAMHTIAEDEARHAALSHQVQAWIMERLDAAARERVRVAQRDAVRALCASTLTTQVTELELRAGLPTREVACSMVAELARTLWADTLAA